VTDPRTEYYDGFLDAMFQVKGLVEENTANDGQIDTDQFLMEFWALQEEISHERGP